MKRIASMLGVLALATHAQDFAAPVEVAPVVEREVAAGRAFVGTVEPLRDSVVGCEVDGLVVKLLAREGDEVKKGQELAQLRTTIIGIRLDGARAELDLRKQELAELENGSRPEEKEQARARLAGAKAEVELREWKLKSAQRLSKSSTISEDELKEAEVALERAHEAVKEAEAARALVDAGPRAERIAQARARVAQQEAEVARLEDDLGRCTIRAPFAGFVVEENTEVGQWLKQGEAVVRIVALDEVDVTIPVLEDYIDGLRVGMPVTITIDAMPGAPVIGKVSAIVASADRSAHTFPVKVRLPNPRGPNGPRLKAGMFARAELAVGEKRKVTLVPKDALVLGGRSPIVYVADEKSGTAQLVPVQLGIAVDGEIEVRGPLQPGQNVVVRGNERLIPGQKIRVGK